MRYLSYIINLIIKDFIFSDSKAFLMLLRTKETTLIILEGSGAEKTRWVSFVILLPISEVALRGVRRFLSCIAILCLINIEVRTTLEFRYIRF